MKCNRCGNTNLKYFYQDENVYYCRKCIQFGRVNVGEEIKSKTYSCKKHRIHPKLDFELTDEQKKVSKQVVEYALNGEDILVYACCGAGKTEITYEVITRFLNDGKKVGFAISRRQVVLEIADRLKKTFPRLNVIAVCQGHTDVDDGDLIVCTMHQLYRYYQTFDLLIMDEVDAFPFKNNEVLENIANNACKGVKVYLTATPSEKLLNSKIHVIELFKRPHGNPLIIPKFIQLPIVLQYLHMFYMLLKHHKQWLVFVPTIVLADQLSKIFSIFKPCKSFTSKTENKEEIIEMFKENKIPILFTSTILERGVTFKNIQILVIQSNHAVFDQSSLIQIAGRVGRDPKHPSGIAIFYGNEKSKAVQECIWALGKMNESM